MGNTHQLLQDLIQTLAKSPRFVVQQEIEERIAGFKPDVVEAMELLDALTASLKNKYDEFTLGDVLHHAAKMRTALDEVSDKEAIDWLCSREGQAEIE